MSAGFPSPLVALLRCPFDGQSVEPVTVHGAGTRIVNGVLRCAACAREFAVSDGIVRLVDVAALHPESLREMQRRDERSASIATGARSEWTSAHADRLEAGPTIRALGPHAGAVVAELGCGTGRFTLPLASQASAVVAIDFSDASLDVLGRKLGDVANVGLVQADVTALRLAPRAFDRVLSTLHSNLPSRAHRAAALRLAAEALRDDGRSVVSMHYHGLRDILFRVPREGYYPDSAIYRYHMTPAEARREAAPFFSQVRCERVGVSLPGVRSLAVSRCAQRLSVLRGFARILLAVAERPRR